jgi:hypothetical protein
MEHAHSHHQGHSHGPVDRSILRSREGVKTVSISLAVLTATALVQVGIYVLCGSVALFADLIHNIGDALTAVPLGIARDHLRHPQDDVGFVAHGAELAHNQPSSEAEPRLADASGGEVGALLATACERCDESPFAWAKRAAGEAGDVQPALDRWTARKAEAFKFTALDFLGDRVTREEGDPKTLSSGSLDRLARVELPNPLNLDTGLRQRLLRDLTGARVRFSYEQRLRLERLRLYLALANSQETGFGNADDFVCQERVELDTIVDRRLPDECKLDAAGEEALDDLAGCRDLDLDDDIGMIAAEAAERVRKKIDTGRGRRSNMNCAGVEAGKRIKFLLSRSQRGKRLACARGKHTARLS